MGKYKLECYEVADCCGSNCDLFFFNTKETTCWGKVDLIGCDDQNEWIHYCKGHSEKLEGGKYIKKY